MYEWIPIRILLFWDCCVGLANVGPQKRGDPTWLQVGVYGVLEDDTALLKHRDTRFAHLRGRSEG